MKDPSADPLRTRPSLLFYAQLAVPIAGIWRFMHYGWALLALGYLAVLRVVGYRNTRIFSDRVVQRQLTGRREVRFDESEVALDLGWLRMIVFKNDDARIRVGLVGWKNQREVIRELRSLFPDLQIPERRTRW